METFSALLAICAGNTPVPGEFPAQRPVTRSFGVFFDLRLKKRLSKQSWGWWSETLSCPLWRHCNGACYYNNHAETMASALNIVSEVGGSRLRCNSIANASYWIFLGYFRNTKKCMHNFIATKKVRSPHTVFFPRRVVVVHKFLNQAIWRVHFILQTVVTRPVCLISLYIMHAVHVQTMA